MRKITALVVAAVASVAIASAVTHDDAVNAYRAGDYDQAYKLFTQLHKAGDDDVQTLGYLGAVSNRRGDAATALDWLAKAMTKLSAEADRDNAATGDQALTDQMAWLGYETQLACKLKKDTVAALKVLDELAAALPANEDIAEERATTLISLGCYEQGRAALRDLIAATGNAVRKEYCNGLLADLGTLPGKREWRDGVLVELKTASEPEKETSIVVYASFPGGNKALRQEIQQRLVWPAGALKARQACRVVVAAKLDTAGNVTETSIVQPGLSREQDAEAMRVVKLLPPFNPATIDGEPVGATVQVPVDFILPE